MIVIRVLGTDEKTDEGQMQKITKELMTLCREQCDDDVYVEFPKDRMQMDLGTEIVVQIFHPSRKIPSVIRLLRKYYPAPVKIGIQAIEAHTVVELN